jgi:hypothetical protein
MDELTPLIAILVIQAALATIVVAPRYLQHLERKAIHRTLRAAIERDVVLHPLVLRSMVSRLWTPAPSAELRCRRGVLWFAVGLGAVLGAVVDGGWGKSLAVVPPGFPWLQLAAGTLIPGVALCLLGLLDHQSGAAVRAERD